MKSFKAYSTLPLPNIPQPQTRPRIKPILTYSMTLDRNGLQKLQKKRLCVRKLDIRNEKNHYEMIMSKTRRELKNMKTLTHLRSESLSQELFHIFYPLSGLLANLERFNTDIHKGEYDLKAFMRLTNRMKRLSNFEDGNKSESIKYAATYSNIYYYRPVWYVFNNPDMKKIWKSHLHIYKKTIAGNFSVRINTTIEDFLSISPILQRFIRRTHFSVGFYPKDYSTDQYWKLLSLIEQNYKISDSSMHLASILYNFHQRIETQERIVSHITSTWTSLKEITLSFEINSTNWFVEQRIDNWKRVAEAIVARLNKPQSFKIIYNIIFNNQVNENTLQDMIVKAASLIQLCSDNQAQNYIEVNITIDCPKTLYGLEDFVEKVLKNIQKINKIKYESRHFLNDWDQRQVRSTFEDIAGMKKISISDNALCELINIV